MGPKNSDQIRRRAGLIFLSMKMTLRNLCVVTQDETWVPHFDPKARKQSMQWKHPGSPSPKKFKRVYSAGMAMASIFWDSHGHYHGELSSGRSHDKRRISCTRTKATASRHC